MSSTVLDNPGTGLMLCLPDKGETAGEWRSGDTDIGIPIADEPFIIATILWLILGLCLVGDMILRIAYAG